jgi:hypothetical protein
MNRCNHACEHTSGGIGMSSYRVSSTWTNNLEGRREAIISRLKARIRKEAIENDKKKLLEEQSVTKQ